VAVARALILSAADSLHGCVATLPIVGSQSVDPQGSICDSKVDSNFRDSAGAYGTDSFSKEEPRL